MSDIQQTQIAAPPLSFVSPTLQHGAVPAEASPLCGFASSEHCRFHAGTIMVSSDLESATLAASCYVDDLHTPAEHGAAAMHRMASLHAGLYWAAPRLIAALHRSRWMQPLVL